MQRLTLAINAGEHVALVGRSGAGKSTLVAGIARLLPVSAGKMMIDQWDSAAVPLLRWRRAIRAIPQDPLVLSGSVGHNLDPTGEASEASLWEALRLAGLDELVLQMPHGLHTPLGSSGKDAHSRSGSKHEGTAEGMDGSGIGSSGLLKTTLSAGHRQLLALARLLLHRGSARLVLLDEPAAGMEESASARLHGVLNERLSHATLVAITHRVRRRNRGHTHHPDRKICPP